MPHLEIFPRLKQASINLDITLAARPNPRHKIPTPEPTLLISSCTPYRLCGEGIAQLLQGHEEAAGATERDAVLGEGLEDYAKGLLQFGLGGGAGEGEGSAMVALG